MGCTRPTACTAVQAEKIAGAALSAADVHCRTGSRNDPPNIPSTWIRALPYRQQKGGATERSGRTGALPYRQQKWILAITSIQFKCTAVQAAETSCRLHPDKCVHCRTGSLEMQQFGAGGAVAVHCRTGSRKARQTSFATCNCALPYRQQKSYPSHKAEYFVHCRTGSRNG